MKKLKSAFVDVTAKMCIECGGEPEPITNSTYESNASEKRKRGRLLKPATTSPALAKNLVGRPPGITQQLGRIVSEYGASSVSNHDNSAIKLSKTSSFRRPNPN